MQRSKQITGLRDYSGKADAFYILYLTHLLHWMFIPFVLALGAVFLGESSSSSNSNQGSGYAVTLGLLMPLFLLITIHFWERKEFDCSVEWGIANRSVLSNNKRGAADWQKQVNNSFTNGVRNTDWLWPLQQDYIQPVSPLIQVGKQTQSLVLGLCLTGFLVFLFMLAFILTRAALVSIGLRSPFFALHVPELVHGICVLTFLRLIDNTCVCLTNISNHRTKEKYHRSLMMKTVAFRVVLFLSPALYIAFVQEALEGSCHFTSCSAASGTCALIAFSLLWARDLFVEYIKPMLVCRCVSLFSVCVCVCVCACACAFYLSFTLSLTTFSTTTMITTITIVAARRTTS